MRPDQERVRNLLIDTVTLLCKNSVPFKDELHVEGLLGVSVDKKDVFFVHISKEFTNSPSEGATVTQDTTDTRDEDVSQTEAAANQGDSSQPKTDTEADKIRIKTESTTSEQDECLIVEDPQVKLEGVASPAQMVAGQRRALKRTSQSSSADHYDDSGSYAEGSGYGVGDGSNSGYGPTGEPYVKRRLSDGDGGGNGPDDGYGDADDSYGGADDNFGGGGDPGDGQGWPNIAGMTGYDPSQQTFHDSDNSQLSMTDSSQPGCSTWSTGPESVEKPKPKGQMFACQVCGKFFINKALLVRHNLIHTGEKPFKCPWCSLRFNQRGNMNRHIRKMHSE